MIPQPLVLNVPREQWAQAQEEEYLYWRDQGADGDDWNDWWIQRFQYFKTVPWQQCRSVLEVGCGPYARNLRWFLENKEAPAFERVAIEDPLLARYMLDGKYVVELVTQREVIPFGVPLEELHAATQTSFDLIVCINVLDHVRIFNDCLISMDRLLNSGGLIVLGQDLSNAEDLQRCPESWLDTKHPIKTDHQAIMDWFASDNYAPMFLNLLPREQGRNPQAHYGTLLYVGQKP